MDYEKKYKESLERARHLHTDAIAMEDSIRAKQCEIIFPELKESEDERIRKALISVLKSDFENDTTIHDISVGDIIAWLEKQGEQPQGKSEVEAAKEEKIDNANKVESKFKTGDWIIDNCGYVWKIEGILNQCYLLEGVEGGESRPTIEWVNKTFHLWTIQDAKDGDVLAEDTYIFIIKKLNNDLTGEVHCCLFDDGDFDLTGSTLGFDEDSTYPATKEQRDLLLKEMYMRGYIFDFEKKELKELKEIEKNPADKVEPKFKIESGKWYMCIRELLDDYGNIAFCKGDVYWSEKDGYLIPCNSNVPRNLTYCVDTYFRNWDISDAKDGDVLNSPTHNLIWIYKDNEHYHACVNMNYVTENVATDGLISIPNDACPATKDEQTILFTKMHEAGYEWDAEKKELKQTYVGMPELKESEDEKMRKALIKYFGEQCDWNDVYGYQVVSWLEKQGKKDKLIQELGEYKIKYTQEVLEKHINSLSNTDDERLRKTTIAFLKNFAEQGYENAVECIDWLEKQGEKPQGKSAVEAIKEEKVDNANKVEPKV